MALKRCKFKMVCCKGMFLGNAQLDVMIVPSYIVRYNVVGEVAARNRFQCDGNLS